MRVPLGTQISPSVLLAFAGIEVSGRPISPIMGISTDSREVQGGDLFLACPGEHTDGGQFIPDAISRGAVCVLSRNESADSRVFLADPVISIGKIAAEYAKRIPHKTVAVTGSVGKTGTVLALREVLSSRFRICAPDGNRNTDLGVPLTVLSMKDDTEILLLEFGMRARGEISYLSRLTNPDCAVITNVGTAHIGRLGSREEIRAAKLEIANGMSPGTLLFCQADDFLTSEAAKLPLRIIPVSENAVSGVSMQVFSETIGEIHCKILTPFGNVDELVLPGQGRAIRQAALFASGVALSLGVPAESVRSSLRRWKMPAQRQQISRHHGVFLLEDCYNASPESMYAAFEVASLFAREGHRIIGVLGDMRELGRFSAPLHFSVGKAFAALSPALLVTYGEDASEIGHGAVSAGMPPSKVYALPSAEPAEAAEVLKSVLVPGDLLLIKASRALRAEEIVRHLFGDN